MSDLMASDVIFVSVTFKKGENFYLRNVILHDDDGYNDDEEVMDEALESIRKESPKTKHAEVFMYQVSRLIK